MIVFLPIVCTGCGVHLDEAGYDCRCDRCRDELDERRQLEGEGVELVREDFESLTVGERRVPCVRKD